MAIQSKSNLVTSINTDLADNNAGLISAADVRENMVDIVESIESIVASGNFYTTYPFTQSLNLKYTEDGQGNFGGILKVGSGIIFSDSSEQTTAFLGVDGLSHNELGDLTAGDPHPQYVLTSGGRILSGDLGFGNNWINCSGAQYVANRGFHGLQFVQSSSTETTINVGSGTKVQFVKDKSYMSSARGVAKAWINFDASGVNHIPVVKDSYGVSGIYKHEPGKFTITFNSGILKDNNYVAFGYSNATSTSGSKEDFVNNTVGLVSRAGDDGTSLRTLTFVVRDEGGQYIDSELNHLVVFGTEPNGSGNPSVTVTVA